MRCIYNSSVLAACRLDHYAWPRRTTTLAPLANERSKFPLLVHPGAVRRPNDPPCVATGAVPGYLPSSVGHRPVEILDGNDTVDVLAFTDMSEY